MGFSAISLTTQMTLVRLGDVSWSLILSQIQQDDVSQFVSDARRRASALSLQRLLSNLIAIPAPQIIGAVRYSTALLQLELSFQVADAFRGDSELDVDRFTSYQKVLLSHLQLLRVITLKNPYFVRSQHSVWLEYLDKRILQNGSSTFDSIDESFTGTGNKLDVHLAFLLFHAFGYIFLRSGCAEVRFHAIIWSTHHKITNFQCPRSTSS